LNPIINNCRYWRCHTLFRRVEPTIEAQGRLQLSFSSQAVEEEMLRFALPSLPFSRFPFPLGQQLPITTLPALERSRRLFIFR
jgi:hypothetical protein